MKRNLLLISNSTNAGEEYLRWPRIYIKEFLDQYGIRKVLFIPFAGVSLTSESIENSFDIYEERVKKVFLELGFELNSIHKEKDPLKMIREAESIAVGGGNTFHLVKMLHETGIMQSIREKILTGTPYLGWSAGANVACPTMKTTNDMPISQPPSFDCLDLVTFQINPHYLDANPAGHGGETREQRINEFLSVNRNVTVVGLRESTLLRIQDERFELIGTRPMRVFRFGEDCKEIVPGGDLSFLH